MSNTGNAALLDCDVVMAGGVTSGLVYPGAVASISRDYRFRSIGGTSVGAVAAALTAAAEFGRQSGKNPSSFSIVARLHEELSALQKNGRTRLFNLFAPERNTRPLFRLLTPFLSAEASPVKWLRFVLVSLSQPAVALAVLAGVAVGLSPTLIGGSGAFVEVAAAAIATIGLVVLAWIVSLALMFNFAWYPAFRQNYYGICIGKNPGNEVSDRLTTWMHRGIQSMAGVAPDGPPLTFGNLWTLTIDQTENDLEASPRELDLAMITSDISRSRMAQLPFIEFPTDLYVEVAVLRAFFPDTVVSWLTEHAQQAGKVSHGRPCVRLPRPQDLPIVVAARMSLSFPVLLSAIPLLAPDYVAGGGRDKVAPLRRVWFSDGGLVSNFPIHFFDGPLPSRPTFCLNLVDFERDLAGNQQMRGGAMARRAKKQPESAASGEPPVGDPVWDLVTMTKGNDLPPVPFTTFDKGGRTSAIGFLNTLLTTARGWNDNQLLVAPGVRERVVNVGLHQDEGGLNLGIKPEGILALDYRGRAAGRMIAARFSPKDEQDPKHGTEKINAFPNHRWVRYRNVMAAAEDYLRRFAQSRYQSDLAAVNRREPAIADLTSSDNAPEIGYHPLPPATRRHFGMVTRQLERAGVRLAAASIADPLRTFDGVATASASDKSGAPAPKIRFQSRPLVANDPRAQRADVQRL